MAIAAGSLFSGLMSLLTTVSSSNIELGNINVLMTSAMLNSSAQFRQIHIINLVLLQHRHFRIGARQSTYVPEFVNWLVGVMGNFHEPRYTKSSLPLYIIWELTPGSLTYTIQHLTFALNMLPIATYLPPPLRPSRISPNDRITNNENMEMIRDGGKLRTMTVVDGDGTLGCNVPAHPKGETAAPQMLLRAPDCAFGIPVSGPCIRI